MENTPKLIDRIIRELDPDLEICYACKGHFPSKKIVKSYESIQKEFGSTTIETNYCTKCAVDANMEWT